MRRRVTRRGWVISARRRADPTVNATGGRGVKGGKFEPREVRAARWRGRDVPPYSPSPPSSSS
eukprot:4609314-Pyramimonas_sp.AAC.1